MMLALRYHETQHWVELGVEVAFPESVMNRPNHDVVTPAASWRLISLQMVRLYVIENPRCIPFVK